MAPSVRGSTRTRASVGRVPPPRITVGVVCSDRVLAEAARAYLRERAEIDVPPGAAEVVLVFGDTLDDDLRAAVDDLATTSDAGGAATATRLVLVVDRLAEQHLWWAIGRGLSAVLPRRTSDWDDVVAALVGTPDGVAHLPPRTVGLLLDQIRGLDARLAGTGVNAAGLTARETEILRLFATGMEIGDVARELNYSERTIKAIVFKARERLGLRNRTHVVAHALRLGAI